MSFVSRHSFDLATVFLVVLNLQYGHGFMSPARYGTFTDRSSVSWPDFGTTTRLNNNSNNNNKGSSPKNFDEDDNIFDVFPEDDDDDHNEQQQQPPPDSSRSVGRRGMELSWCSSQTRCLVTTNIRETVVRGEEDENQITFLGPATGQVTYSWSSSSVDDDDATKTPSVLLLVKRDDDELMTAAADAVRELSGDDAGLRVLLDPELAAKLKHYFGVDGDRIDLFERRPVDGFGANRYEMERSPKFTSSRERGGSRYDTPDLVCTLGGDGLLMYAGSLFPGPMPPTLCVAGGSMGFLTPFTKEEMVGAIQQSLKMILKNNNNNNSNSNNSNNNNSNNNSHFKNRPSDSNNYKEDVINQPPLFMEPWYDNYNKHKKHSILLEDDDDVKDTTATTVGGGTIAATTNKPPNLGRQQQGICVSMRMRLDCRVVNREGIVRARHNVLNEIVIDRGSSPFLSNLECFCDDVHLTTVQADGIIFATPTGSTAYSMAAGGSVVHPAVPAILVTPICPHVLSFRSMVFPDHVVLRCYVPDDARSGACVAFDGKQREELQRGDSVQIQMSIHPVPTINKVDHSADWLDSLKNNFHFNSRPRQKSF